MESEAARRTFVGKMLAAGAAFALAAAVLLEGLAGTTPAPSATAPSAESERATITAAVIVDARASNAIDLGALHAATLASSPAKGRVDPPRDASPGVR